MDILKAIMALGPSVYSKQLTCYFGVRGFNLFTRHQKPKYLSKRITDQRVLGAQRVESGGKSRAKGKEAEKR